MKGCRWSGREKQTGLGVISHVQAATRSPLDSQGRPLPDPAVCHPPSASSPRSFAGGATNPARRSPAASPFWFVSVLSASASGPPLRALFPRPPSVLSSGGMGAGSFKAWLGDGRLPAPSLFAAPACGCSRRSSQPASPASRHAARAGQPARSDRVPLTSSLRNFSPMEERSSLLVQAPPPPARA